REAETQSHIEEDEEVHTSKEAQASDDPRMVKINELLDEQLRPYLLADGGGLKILGINGDRLKIHYQGSCGTWPTATSGTLYAIERVIKRIDHDIQVVSV